MSIFWNRTHKNSPDRQQWDQFRKSQHCGKTLHPNGRILSVEYTYMYHSLGKLGGEEIYFIPTYIIAKLFIAILSLAGSLQL